MPDRRFVQILEMPVHLWEGFTKIASDNSEIPSSVLEFWFYCSYLIKSIEWFQVSKIRDKNLP